MASAPFNIAETAPGDSDIVSQFPAAERTYRDVVESWLSVDHNTSGQHAKVSLPQVAAPTMATDITAIWQDSSAALLTRNGAGSTEFLQVPPGVVVPFAGSSSPNGWLLCAGQNVSRTTYARLFTAIGTTHGVGDGSSTFGLPSLNGRVVVGKDNMNSTDANRVTTAGSGVDGDTLGATGGAESVVLAEANLPSHTHTVTDPGHLHTFSDVRTTGGGVGITGGSGVSVTTQSSSTDSATTGISLGSTGSGTAHNNMPPSIVLNYIIKV